MDPKGCLFHQSSIWYKFTWGDGFFWKESQPKLTYQALWCGGSLLLPARAMEVPGKGEYEKGKV